MPGSRNSIVPAVTRSPGELWCHALRAPHMPALDGMRAVAVFMVILGHLSVPYVAADLGVSIFFVLSGFLITWLLLRESGAAGGISLPRFYARRALRIFPAYFVYLAFTFSLDTVLGDLRWRQVLLPAVTYTVNYYNALHGHPTTSVAHAWSLAVEEQFYLLWPLTLVFLLPRGSAHVTRFLVGAILAVVAIRSALYYGIGVGTAYVYNAFETRFDNLAVGCLLAVTALTPAVERIANVVAARPWYPVITIALLQGARFGLGNNFRYGPGLTLEAILVAILLVQIIVLVRRQPWRILELGVIAYLGRLSYSLYLYHGWGSALGGKVVTTAGLPRLAAQLAGCLALAMGSYHIVEMPFLRLKRRFAGSAR